jgi:hypothetical protein
MKPVIMVMSVMDADGKQAVACSIGLVKGQDYQYLGSLRCDFAQFGIINSLLKKVPTAFIEYKKEKWDAYLADIMKQIMECK